MKALYIIYRYFYPSFRTYVDLKGIISLMKEFLVNYRVYTIEEKPVNEKPWKNHKSINKFTVSL